MKIGNWAWVGLVTSSLMGCSASTTNSNSSSASSAASSSGSSSSSGSTSASSSSGSTGSTGSTGSSGSSGSGSTGSDGCTATFTGGVQTHMECAVTVSYSQGQTVLVVAPEGQAHDASGADLELDFLSSLYVAGQGLPTGAFTDSLPISQEGTSLSLHADSSQQWSHSYSGSGPVPTGSFNATISSAGTFDGDGQHYDGVHGSIFVVAPALSPNAAADTTIRIQF